MAEALGITSAILAIVEFAFETSITLYEQISSLKSHVETVSNLQFDLGALTALLQTLQVQLGAEGATCDDARLEPIKAPLLESGKACKALAEMLKSCAADASSKREIAKKWLRMQYKGKSIDETRSLLASYKSTLAIALDIVNLHDREQTQQNLEALKDRIEDLKHDLDSRLDQVRDALENSNVERQTQLEKDCKALSDALHFCDQALLAAEQTRPLPSVALDNNGATNSSRQYIGADNYDGTYNFSASSNKASTNSLQAIGMYSPESIKAMSESAPLATAHMLKVALETTSNLRYGVGSASSSVPATSWNRIQSAEDDEVPQADFSLPKRWAPNST